MYLENEGPLPGSGFRKILIGVLVVTFVLVGYLLVNRGKGQEAKTQVEQMQMDLDAHRTAMNGQRDRLVELSREVDSLKQSIDSGEAANPKQAAIDYAKYAKEQRTAREEYLKMQADYNEKAVAFQKLKDQEEQ